MNELTDVDVVALAKVHHSEESFADDSRQVCVCQEGHLVDALLLVVGVRDQVLEDVPEVRDGHILLELLVGEDLVVDQLDLVVGCQIAFHLKVVEFGL